MRDEIACDHCLPGTVSAPWKSLKSTVDTTLRGINDLKYAYLTMPKARTVKPLIVSSCPESWVQRYSRSRYHLIDPVIQFGLHSVAPFLWNKALSCTLEKTGSELFRQSGKYHISSGATFTLHDGEGLFAALSLCNTEQDEHVEELIFSRAADIQMALIHFHDDLTDSTPLDVLFPASQAGTLSAREMGVLKWVVMGKASSEIADIYAISERTVKFHMSNISGKLDVRNAKQAVYKAISLGMV